jgi:hypothetical protein
MAKISIELDVLNSAEIVSKKKGALLGSLAALGLSEKRLKRKVEQEICKEMVLKLKENLDEVFKEQGISARLRITSKA